MYLFIRFPFSFLIGVVRDKTMKPKKIAYYSLIVKFEIVAHIPFEIGYRHGIYKWWVREERIGYENEK